MRLDSQKLELSRTRPSRVKLDLFVFEPRAVLKARINGTVSKGDMQIPYGNVITGSYLSTEPNMAVLVGSTEGGHDYGRIRLRSGSSSYLSVAENDGVQWVSGAYLTVLRYFDVLPVYPRIIQNPSVDTDVIFYKDYDIPYLGQNNSLGAFINMGSHRGVKLENGTGTVYYSSTGTLSLMGSSMSYEWAFEGGTPTGSTIANPGNVHYSSPGDYVTRLKVTANGTTDVSYRYIAVRDRQGYGSNPPIAKWKIDQIQGSRSAGGYSAKITVYESVNIQDNSCIIISAEEWYGNTKSNLGGNNPGGEDIFFVGYVESGSIQYSYDKSSVSFTVSSVTAIMKSTTGYSISVESKQGAGNWYELQDMDVRRAIYHYLRWHTTVLLTTDVRFRGDDRKIQFFDADRGSLFDAINVLMSDALMGSVCSDRQGAIYLEVAPHGYENPTGSFIPVMEITNRDWKGEPSIDYVPTSPMSYVELGGIAYSGAITGTYVALLSGAPGDVPLEHGGIDTDPGGLALNSQEQLNQLTGNLLYSKNQKYPRITFENANPMKNLDIAPYEAVQINILSSDTVSNVEIHSLYYPSSMQFNYSPTNETLISGMEVEGIVTGIPGDTIIIPETSDDVYSFDTEFPNFTFPPFSLDMPTFEIVDPMSMNNVLTWIEGYGFYYTNNYADDFPSWNRMMVNVLPTYGNLINAEITASGEVFAHFQEYVLKAASLGAAWEVVFDAAIEVDNPEGFPFPRGQSVMALAVDRTSSEDIFILAGLVVSIFSTFIVYGYIWNGSKFTRINSTFSISPSAGPRYGWMVKVGDAWKLSYFNGSDIASVATVNPNTFVLSDIHTVSPESGGDNVLDKSKFSPSRWPATRRPYP